MSIEYEQQNFTQIIPPRVAKPQGISGLVMRYSVGLVKTESQAQWVMLGIIIAAITISILILLRSRPENVKLDRSIYIDQTKGNITI